MVPKITGANQQTKEEKLNMVNPITKKRFDKKPTTKLETRIDIIH